jgi:hypothetical protein
MEPFYYENVAHFLFSASVGAEAGNVSSITSEITLETALWCGLFSSGHNPALVERRQLYSSAVGRHYDEDTNHLL